MIAGRGGISGDRVSHSGCDESDKGMSTRCFGYEHNDGERRL
ncbi:MAG: hypothetical protein ABSF59_09120 [Candidatus Sulfotelmatobacter sp.]